MISRFKKGSNDLDFIILSEYIDKKNKLWSDIQTYCQNGWKIFESLIMAHKGKTDKIFVVLQKLI